MDASTSPAIRAVCDANGVYEGMIQQRVFEYGDVSACWDLPSAAIAGHLCLIQRLITRIDKPRGHALRSPCDRDVMYLAAKYGHLHVLQWLHAHSDRVAIQCTTDAMDMAAANGHLEVVQWLHYNRSEGCTTHAMDLAAQNGHLDVVMWLHDHRSEGCTTYAMDSAAAAGDLKMVRWLHLHRDEGCTHVALGEASYAGDIPMVRWLVRFRTEGYVLDAIECASLRQHYDLVQWLHAHAYLRDPIDPEDDDEDHDLRWLRPSLDPRPLVLAYM